MLQYMMHKWLYFYI